MQMKPSHKALILSLLVLCCIAVLAGGTYAAYTSDSSVKRVIQAQTGTVSEETRFSSNYLIDGGDKGGICVVSIPDTATEANINITVCNYPQGYPNLRNDQNIIYDIEFSDSSENSSGVTLIPRNGSELKGVILQGGKTSSQLYTLNIPQADLEKFNAAGGNCYITVTATPAQGSNLPTLSRKFQIVKTAAQKVGWEGKITSMDDAINYQIHGTQEQQLTITWDNTVTLSPWSAKLFTSEPVTGNSLTVHVGAEGTPTSYLLQFYWVNGSQNTTPSISCN